MISARLLAALQHARRIRTHFILPNTSYVFYFGAVLKLSSCTPAVLPVAQQHSNSFCFVAHKNTTYCCLYLFYRNSRHSKNAKNPKLSPAHMNTRRYYHKTDSIIASVSNLQYTGRDHQTNNRGHRQTNGNRGVWEVFWGGGGGAYRVNGCRIHNSRHAPSPRDGRSARFASRRSTRTRTCTCTCEYLFSDVRHQKVVSRFFSSPAK